eukprot:scaffold65810_cov24-Tisochrysis_lutea.AAC.2
MVDSLHGLHLAIVMQNACSAATATHRLQRFPHLSSQNCDFGNIHMLCQLPVLPKKGKEVKNGPPWALLVL